MTAITAHVLNLTITNLSRWRWWRRQFMSSDCWSYFSHTTGLFLRTNYCGDTMAIIVNHSLRPTEKGGNKAWGQVVVVRRRLPVQFYFYTLWIRYWVIVSQPICVWFSYQKALNRLRIKWWHCTMLIADRTVHQPSNLDNHKSTSILASPRKLAMLSQNAIISSLSCNPFQCTVLQ